MTDSHAASPPIDEPLWHTVKRDFSAASGLALLGVVALLGWMAFQWGFGNDALLPPIVAWVFDGIDDDTSWSAGLLGVAGAMAAGFLFWGATQLLDAIIMLSGLRLIPGITARVSHFLRDKGWVTPYRDMSWSTRWIIAYATGASALCLVDFFATGEGGLRQRRQMVTSAVVLSAGTVSLVVGVLAGAAMVAKRVPATEGAADTLIRYAKNPLVWILIFTTVFAVGHLRSRRSPGDHS